MRSADLPDVMIRQFTVREGSWTGAHPAAVVVMYFSILGMFVLLHRTGIITASASFAVMAAATAISMTTDQVMEHQLWRRFRDHPHPPQLAIHLRAATKVASVVVPTYAAGISSTQMVIILGVASPLAVWAGSTAVPIIALYTALWLTLGEAVVALGFLPQVVPASTGLALTALSATAFGGALFHWHVVTSEGERVRTVELTRAEESQVLLDRAADAIVVIEDGAITYANEATAQLSGRDKTELIGLALTELVDPATRSELDQLYDPSSSQHAELALRRPSGVRRWVTATASRSDALGAAATVLNLHDVTVTRSLHQQLQFEATHDPLTGLLNRSAFRQRCEHLLGDRSPTDSPLTMLFIDLDRLKLVNDTHGHRAGDLALAELTHRLDDCVRMQVEQLEHTAIGRVGGDEFAVVIHGDRSLEDSARIAARFVEVAAEPVELAGTHATLGASIGLAIAANGDDFDTLMGHADTAMYQAKRGGRSQFIWHFHQATRTESAYA